MILLEDFMFCSQFDWKGLSNLRGCLFKTTNLGFPASFRGIILDYSKVGNNLELIILTRQTKIIQHNTMLFRCRLL